MKIVRYILFPIVPIYFLVTWLRNLFYNVGIFKSSKYDIPIICVGNLSVGGTGKTPMIEYLIRLLKNDYQVATLSRGYKRLSKGFVIADENASAITIGDEPFQFYSKFNNVIVSVDADRRNGISQLLKLNPKPEVLLLDDAFQHRKVKARFNILLTSFDNLYVEDIMLPTGDLREPKSGANRADVIVVTKCPKGLSEDGKNEIIKSLKPKKDQQVYFSSIVYSDFIRNSSKEKVLEFLMDKSFTLVTGIANAKPLVDYLKSKKLAFEHLNFKDHHEFDESDIQNLKTKDWILTTEKDFMRLQPYFKESKQLFYLPIATTIDHASGFDASIKMAIT